MVKLWEKQAHEAIDCGDKVAEFLSEHIGSSVRLVMKSPNQIRLAGGSKKDSMPDYTPWHRPVVFADGYPFHVACVSSVRELNRNNSKKQFDILQFRANVNVSGTEPYEEELWRDIKVGDAILRYGRLCTRCSVPSVDPSIGKKSKHMAKHMETNKGFQVPEEETKLFGERVTVFGVVYCHDEASVGKVNISVGDVVEVLSRETVKTIL